MFSYVNAPAVNNLAAGIATGTYPASVIPSAFTPMHAYVATLAMRLGQPVPPAQLVRWSPQALASAKASANKRLSVAQANALRAKAAGATLAPAKLLQLQALKAWAVAANAWGGTPPQVSSGLAANAALVAAGQHSKGQSALVLKVYSAWYAAVRPQVG